LKLPFRICWKICSDVSERFAVEVFGVVEVLTWNFCDRICVRTWVFRSVDFFRVKILSCGSMLNFRIVRKTFLSK